MKDKIGNLFLPLKRYTSDRSRYLSGRVSIFSPSLKLSVRFFVTLSLLKWLSRLGEKWGGFDSVFCLGMSRLKTITVFVGKIVDLTDDPWVVRKLIWSLHVYYSFLGWRDGLGDYTRPSPGPGNTDNKEESRREFHHDQIFKGTKTKERIRKNIFKEGWTGWQGVDCRETVKRGTTLWMGSCR